MRSRAAHTAFEPPTIPIEHRMRYTSIMPAGRLGRWLGACAALGGLAGCADPVVHPLEYPPDNSDPGRIVVAVNHEVDVLFVIDNSGSMAEEQATLVADIGAFFEVLERPEVTADYRIGFTTTDDGNPLCDDVTTPEHGALRLSSCHSRPTEYVIDGGVPDTAFDEICLAYCPEAWAELAVEPTMVWGEDEAKPRPWLERTTGRTNLPEGLSPTQAFQCVASQGIDGCGFESQLESMYQAMQRSQSDGDPAKGFMRDGAIFSVVFVTDEDDCSANKDWESIFSPEGSRLFWSDPDAAAPTSAVCWNAGVLCEGGGEGTYDDCRSIDLDEDGSEISGGAAAEANAVLRPVERYAGALATLESIKRELNPDQDVLVSVIGGFNADGSVTYADSTEDPQFQSDFGIGPGCEGPKGRAVPPVRLRELADVFGLHSDRNRFSICDDGYAGSLATIAQGIANQIKPSCFPSCVADMEPDTPDSLEPSCRVLQRAPQPDGSLEATWVLPCEDDGSGSLPAGEDACFVMRVEDQRSDYCTALGFNLEFVLVRREGVIAPSGAEISAECNLSQDKSTDCPELP